MICELEYRSICFRESIEMEVLELANIKSAKKRILVSRKRADRNKSVRSRIKTAVKKVDVAIECSSCSCFRA